MTPIHNDRHFTERENQGLEELNNLSKATEAGRWTGVLVRQSLCTETHYPVWSSAS